jgi:hypothetical protein
MAYRNGFPVVDTAAEEAMAAVVAIVGWMVVMVEVAVAIAVQVVAAVMAVAIAVVGIADIGLVVVALFILPVNVTPNTFNSVCLLL